MPKWLGVLKLKASVLVSHLLTYEMLSFCLKWDCTRLLLGMLHLF